MCRYILYCLILNLSLSQYAYGKDFLREYTYKASEYDSKVTARSNAIEQSKLLLLEEIGTYIHSYVEIEQKSSSNASSNFMSHEIRNITAGITNTTILNESWDGETYKLKTKISVNINDVVKKLRQAIEERKNNEDLIGLRKAVSEKDKIINKLSGEIKNQKELLESKEINLSSLSDELAHLHVKLNAYTQKQRKIETAITIIEDRIKTATALTEKLIPGMTISEVVATAGKPSSKELCALTGEEYLNYGKKWVMTTDGIYTRSIDLNQYIGACNTGIHLR